MKASPALNMQTAASRAAQLGCSVDLEVAPNGNVRCCIWTASVVEGAQQVAAAGGSLAAELTVLITSSPVRSNPSTRMVQESLASLDAFGGCAECRKLILCDGVTVKPKSRPKVGCVTAGEAELYSEYVARLGALCRDDASFGRTRVVQLGSRLGSAHAIRHALLHHVTTPFVIIVPHDCVLARPVPLRDVVRSMAGSAGAVRYVKLLGRSTLTYANRVASQHQVRLETTRAFGTMAGALTYLYQ
jgi:hypothetical protein